PPAGEGARRAGEGSAVGPSSGASRHLLPQAGEGKDMKIIFMGTPEFAVPTLHEIVAAYTRAPKPAGRGQAERKSPVHEAAEGLGIPVFTPKSLRGEAEQMLFASHAADVAVIVAYG